MQEHTVHSATKRKRIDWWLRAQSQGTPQLRFPADLRKCLGKLTKGKPTPNGETAEILLTPPEFHSDCVAHGAERMFSDLKFDDSWFRVVASLTHQKPHPQSLNEIRPISCMTTFRHLFGNLWRQTLPRITCKVAADGLHSTQGQRLCL